MLRKSVAVGGIAALVSMCFNGLAYAQSAAPYPNKVIRMIAGPAGSNIDLVARVVAQGIAPILGQQVIVQNQPDLLAIETVLGAPPDGYTLLFLASAVWIKPQMQKVNYDPVKDLLPITRAASAPSFLFTSAALPAKSVRELIAYAKANPGKLNYGMAGVGTSGHLAAELFKNMAGVDIVRVAYKGSADMMTNLVGNQIQLAFSSASTGMNHVAAGRLRVLGVGNAKPSELAPDVPTIGSAGVPGYEVTAEQCLWVPSGTPAAIVSRLSEAVLRVLSNAEVKKKLLVDGTETIGTTPEQTAAYIKTDMVKWAKLVKEANLHSD